MISSPDKVLFPADGITKRFDDFVAAEEADTGQPHHVIAPAFVPRGAANFKIFADIIKNVPAESFVMDTPDGAGALNYAIRRLPVVARNWPAVSIVAREVRRGQS